MLGIHLIEQDTKTIRQEYNDIMKLLCQHGDASNHNAKILQELSGKKCEFSGLSIFISEYKRGMKFWEPVNTDILSSNIYKRIFHRD